MKKSKEQLMITKCNNKKISFKGNFNLNSNTKESTKECNYPIKGYSINKGEVKIRHTHIECKSKRRIIRKKRVIVKITNLENEESILRRLKFSANLNDYTLLTDWEGNIILNSDDYEQDKKNEKIKLKIKNANFFEENWLFYWKHPDNLHAYTFKITLLAFIFSIVGLVVGLLSYFGS